MMPTHCAMCGCAHESLVCLHYVPPRQAQQPFKCPVCDGHTTVSKPSYIAGDVLTWEAGDTASHPCPACSGTGIVWGPPQ